MKTNASFLSRSWRPALIILSIAALSYLLYFHDIAQLVPRFSAGEIQTYRSADDWHDIVRDPTNAPYKAVLWLTVALGHQGYIQTRLVAGCFGLVALVSFCLILRRWYGTRTAALATALFATSTGFLHLARLGSPLILQMSVLPLIALGILAADSSRKKVAAYGITALAAIMLYIPGMAWLLIAGVIILRKNIASKVMEIGRLQSSLLAVLFIALISPLVVAAARTPGIIKGLFGLPQHLGDIMHAPLDVLHNLSTIGFISDGNAELFVGRTPLLSIIGVVLLMVGVIMIFRRPTDNRSLFLLSGSGLALIIPAFSGATPIGLLVPFLYLFIAGGIHELLGDWLRVFPRNPIARQVGTGLVCIMLFFAVLYQTRSYFIAWPHADATRQTFRYPQP